MSCDELNATLAWLYGEGDEAQAMHIASCPACMAVVADHEQVLSAVTRSRPVSDSSSRASVSGGTFRQWGWATGIAAAFMAVVLISGDPFAVEPEPTDQGQIEETFELFAWDVELDADLEELAWDVLVLSDDGSIL
jgi:hypothetical protein